MNKIYNILYFFGITTQSGNCSAAGAVQLQRSGGSATAAQRGKYIRISNCRIMPLTNEQKKELIKCSAGIITKDEIQRIIEPVSYDEYFYLLNDSLDKDDSSFFEALLWDLPNDLTFQEEESILKFFIVDVRHREHESIATSFQVRFNNNIDNISTLLKSVDLIPQYLESYDFKYSYIRKIIYAIGAQPEPYNIEGLEKLSNGTNDNEVRNLAVHQIKKRKELGRWEFRKNTESES